MVANNGKSERRARKNAPPPPPPKRTGTAPKAKRPRRRRPGTSHESTGNVLGEIAGSAASAIPVIGPILGPIAKAAIGGLTGGVSNQRWSGNGAVKIQENSLLDKKNGTLTKVIDGQDGWTKFKYVEVIGNVISAANAGAFTKQAIRVNPADEDTFEWLGPAADGYSQYKIAGMWAELNSQTSVVAPDDGSALGRWGIAGQYNPALQEGYSTLNQCLQADGGQNGMVCSDIQWAAECKPRDSNYSAGLYTSAGSPPEGMNFAQTDPFVVVVFSDGVQTPNQVLGILKFHYEFWCCKKTLTPSSASNVADIFQGETDIQEDAPFGVEIVACATNTIGGTLTNQIIDVPGGGTVNGSRYRFPDVTGTGRFLFVLWQSQSGSALAFTTGSMRLQPSENCSVIADVLTPDGVSDFPNSQLQSLVGTTVLGPSAGVTTGAPASGVGVATQYTFFVDVTRGNAYVDFVWSGYTADSSPVAAGLIVTAFPKVVTFNPPDLSKKMIFRNGVALNRLALGLESAENHKDVALIVKQMRMSLAASGKNNADLDILRNLHKKKHRDILKDYDFGRLPEETSMQKQLDLLTALVTRTLQPTPPQISAPTPRRLESESDTDDEHELEREVRSLRRQISVLQKAEKHVVKAKQPAGSISKSPMSYGIVARTSESPLGVPGLTVTDLLPKELDSTD